jgi:hydrocephalus-inducing protein
MAAGSEADSIVQTSSKGGMKPITNHLFDILPIEGTVNAGQTEQVDFSFYAFPGVKATATAACAVKNGPTYEVGRQAAFVGC